MTCAASGRACSWRSLWLPLLLSAWLACGPIAAEGLTKAQQETLLGILNDLSTGLAESKQGLDELKRGLSEINSGLVTSRQGSEKALKETEQLSRDLIAQKQEVSELRQDSTELKAQLTASVSLSKKIEAELTLWKWVSIGSGGLAVLAFVAYMTHPP